MPSKREVVRCASCATLLPAGIDFTAKCPRCNAELHSCKQCSFFDSASRFECTQPVSARIPKKDARNQCNFYSLREPPSNGRLLPPGRWMLAKLSKTFSESKRAVAALMKLATIYGVLGVAPYRTNCL
jgi:phage FluMu protein Com